MKFTVLIPTFDNGPMLRYALLSVLAQSEQDFEVFVVGDGAPDTTADLVGEFARTDPRIRYFANPKGERHGEAHRHAALAEATGDGVCYLADDDVWLPTHLAIMGSLLARGDFAHTMHVGVYPDYRVVAIDAYATDPAMRRRMLEERFNIFGPTFVGHTLAAYRRWPVAWSPAPAGIESDLFQWRKWLSIPECRVVAHAEITALSLPHALRTWMPASARLGEAHFWWSLVAQPAFREILRERFTAPLKTKSVPADHLITLALQRAGRTR